MREILWWILVAALMVVMFAVCFLVLLWMWSVSGISRETYAMFAALSVFSGLSAIITYNFGNWLKARFDD